MKDKERSEKDERNVDEDGNNGWRMAFRGHKI